MAYPNGCRRYFTILPRLRPCPVRGHRLLYGFQKHNSCMVKQKKINFCMVLMCMRWCRVRACAMLRCWCGLETSTTALTPPTKMPLTASAAMTWNTYLKGYVTFSFYENSSFPYEISSFSHVTSSFPYACADPGHHTSCSSFCAAVHVHLFVLHSHAELSSILVSHVALSVPCHVTLQLCCKEQVFAQFDSCLCHEQGLAGSSCLLF